MRLSTSMIIIHVSRPFFSLANIQKSYRAHGQEAQEVKIKVTLHQPYIGQLSIFGIFSSCNNIRAWIDRIRMVFIAAVSKPLHSLLHLTICRHSNAVPNQFMHIQLKLLAVTVLLLQVLSLSSLAVCMLLVALTL